MLLQYGAVGSKVPTAALPADIDPPAPALQLKPVPGRSPSQVKLSVETTLPFGCSTTASVRNASMLSTLVGLRFTNTV
jgi:hypothetical protein